MFSRDALDAGGMVVDFCEAQRALERAVSDFHHTDLNGHEAFGSSVPTAEVLARVVFDRMRGRGLSSLSRVEVTESPGCVATYQREA